MPAQSYARFAAILFSLIALAQAARAITHAEVLIAGHAIPVVASWVAAAIFALLAFLGFTAKSS